MCGIRLSAGLTFGNLCRRSCPCLGIKVKAGIDSVKKQGNRLFVNAEGLHWLLIKGIVIVYKKSFLGYYKIVFLIALNATA